MWKIGIFGNPVCYPKLYGLLGWIDRNRFIIILKVRKIHIFNEISTKIIENSEKRKFHVAADVRNSKLQSAARFCGRGLTSGFARVRRGFHTDFWKMCVSDISRRKLRYDLHFKELLDKYNSYYSFRFEIS